MQMNFSSISNQTREGVSSFSQKVLQLVDRYPFFSFLGLIGVVVVLIVIGNFLRRPDTEIVAADTTPTPVEVFSIGQAPRMTMQAKVEKSNAVKVMAQSGGIVQSIRKQPGQQVRKGEVLANLSTNATGGSIPSLNRQLSQKNFALVEENFPIQQDLIRQRRQVAESQETQAAELRELTDNSLADTRTLIAMNEEIYDTLDDQVEQLKANPATATSSALLQAQQARAGVLSGLQSLRTALRTSEYQASDEQEPAELAQLSKEIALNQLQLEERSLELNKEIAELNLRIAQISESLMFPSAPCAGVVERYYVLAGQSINPGQPVAALRCAEGSTELIVNVSGEVAKGISRLEPSTVQINGDQVELQPLYISQEPTDGTLHAVIYALPDYLQNTIPAGGFVQISVPVGTAQSTSAVPFIPLDAVYQPERSAYVYIGRPTDQGYLAVESREVELGRVFGRYVEVQSGLGDEVVIVDRNVMEGDRVTAQ